jgi:hypothetical protein
VKIISGARPFYGESIGILTADGEMLEPRYSRAVEIDESGSVVVQGALGTPACYETFVMNGC